MAEFCNPGVYLVTELVLYPWEPFLLSYSSEKYLKENALLNSMVLFFTIAKIVSKKGFVDLWNKTKFYVYKSMCTCTYITGNIFLLTLQQNSDLEVYYYYCFLFSFWLQGLGPLGAVPACCSSHLLQGLQGLFSLLDDIWKPVSFCIHWRFSIQCCLYLFIVSQIPINLNSFWISSLHNYNCVW